MPDAPSSARRFFERIVNADDPAAFIRALAPSDPPTYEGDWLDFKRPCPDDRTKELWSKALSGFANTEGGVIVWGVIAEKDASGVDAANGIALVQNPAAVVSRLMQLHHVATDPPVAGVDVRPILNAGASNEGFVVCHVPESGYKPHRAEHVEGRPYYIRAGDDFAMPSPALLRHLFYPKISANLRVSVAPAWDLWDGAGFAPQSRFKFQLQVLNDGTATARDVFVTVRPLAGMRLNAEPGWVRRDSLNGPGVAYTEPLHPGVAVRMCWISYLPPPDQLTFLENDTNKPLPASPIKLRMALHCQDQDQRRAAVSFEPADFISPRMIVAEPE